MTVVQQIVLKLIRKAIDPSYYWFIDKRADWKTVVDFALKQGVVGITFDAYKEIRDIRNKELRKFHPNELELMAWFGYANILEKKYVAHKQTIENLSAFYQNNGVEMLLLKGYGLSLYWPTPQHRPSGDIDIYLFGEWQNADKAISEQCGIEVDNGHHHHTVFEYEGTSVENHYDLINVHSHSQNKEIEHHYKNLAQVKGEEILPNVYLPIPQLEVEFTLRHAATHFSSGEMTLRQLLDCILLCKARTSEIDWTEFWTFAKEYGFDRCVQAIIDIAVKYFGVDREIFHSPLASDEDLAEKVLEDICNPDFSGERPKGYIPYFCWMLKRWWAHRWKHKLVYNESLMTTFFAQMRAHLLKPSTLKG